MNIYTISCNVQYRFMINTSVGEVVRVWYTVVHNVSEGTEGTLLSTLWSRVENYGCMSEENHGF